MAFFVKRLKTLFNRVLIGLIVQPTYVEEQNLPFRPLVWGNQETMWPMSRAALSANASERLMALATPKKDFQQDHPLKCNRYYTKPVTSQGLILTMYHAKSYQSIRYRARHDRSESVRVCHKPLSFSLNQFLVRKEAPGKKPNVLIINSL